MFVTPNDDRALALVIGLLRVVICALGSLPLHKLSAFGEMTDVNWDDRFSAVGVNRPINTMAFVKSDLYVAGAFTRAGGIAATNIRKFDGARWSDIGGLNVAVATLATDGTNLFAGGEFTMAGG